MTAFIDKPLISKSNVLVVGAGGIGCEILKNLVLTGFEHISVIDLDTIEVSNLNRQFLFRRQHVGMSKAKVAAEAVVGFRPKAIVKPYHESVMDSCFNLDFYKQFDCVLNALDNRAARSHVNMMCMDADVPLVESGTAGYLGQLQVIKRGRFECYDCVSKGPERKSYPGCTIRNTPSEPIHCIVWAKHLFNQLFGADDPDEDVSPDTADPEAVGDAGQAALNSESLHTDEARVSTQAWAREIHYDARKLFHKFFNDDIKYLLSMEKLWENREPPTPLEWCGGDIVSADGMNGSGDAGKRRRMSEQQSIWSIEKCCQVFAHTLLLLKHVQQRALDGSGGKSHELVWDKDDDVCMDFVTAVANLRCNIFNIPQKCRFDVKSMAGHIIPAIATTNAIIGALVVMEVVKVISGQVDKCQNTYLNKDANYKGALWSLCEPSPPNSKCPICKVVPQVTLLVNVNEFEVGALRDVLRGEMDMREPDVEIHGRGNIIISSDWEETATNEKKPLSHFKLDTNHMLECDDFSRKYKFNVVLRHDSSFTGNRFMVQGDVDAVKATASDSDNGESEKNGENGENGEDGSNGADVEVCDAEPVVTSTTADTGGTSNKRKLSDDNGEEQKEEQGAKRVRVSNDTLHVIDLD